MTRVVLEKFVVMSRHRKTGKANIEDGKVFDCIADALRERQRIEAEDKRNQKEFAVRIAFVSAIF